MTDQDAPGLPGGTLSEPPAARAFERPRPGERAAGWNHEDDFGEYRRIVLSYLLHDWENGLFRPIELLSEAVDRTGRYLYSRYADYYASGLLATEKGKLQAKVDRATAVARMLEAPELAKLETVQFLARLLRQALELPDPPTEGR